MTYKATIEDTKMKPWIACIDIHDENGDFVAGYYVTELNDKRKAEAK